MNETLNEETPPVINEETINEETKNEETKNEENRNEEENSEYNFTSWDNLAYGFEKPSPIQMKAIKPIMLKRDLLAQAQSGTGKTATFSIGALSRIVIKDNFTQVLIMSPTHELTTQISGVISGLGAMINGLRIKTIMGGSSIDEDAAEMRKNVPHVIVGTPGRVFDMIRRRHINAKKLKLMVLDEADEMLSSGFKDQVYNIFQYLNSEIQIALFSATIPNEMIPLTEKFMRNPIRISVKVEQLTLEGIKQFYVALDDDMQKYDTLKDIYNKLIFSQCIIYCNKSTSCNRIY